MATRQTITISAALFLGTLGVSGIAMPAFAQKTAATVLNGLDKGMWTIRFRDGTPSRRICVKQGSDLIQLRHRGSNCRRYVVENSGNVASVQYSCPGNGFGRTSVRRESSSLVQLESQGIAGGQPFEFTAEARRTGPCG
ncbi:hypothetical protein HME9302_02237 [Alteripontixanthobacter maritimus]|uniref:Uncharacterized protein n=1 Tax=Alteripontixanthobacter maritimus TaxID=2161824 RepID=A0A369Q9J4_9SPHN|nr:DUF3617 family protein [Alteripontixanthobacter maritimus]RDC61020.1 hypothetical protein HME9302_02237 [Alteripontixanthobacter maritimus]